MTFGMVATEENKDSVI